MLSLFSPSPIKLRYAFQFPNSVPHSALHLCFPSTSSLHSRSQSQPLDEAVDSFTRMLSMRRTPPIIQFNKILGSLSKTKQFHAAVSLFQQLQGRGIAPDLFTLSIVINCCCGMGRMTLAFSVLAKIFRMDYQPNTVTSTTILKGLYLCGSVEKVVHFHDRVLAHGFQLNQVTYGTLINGLCAKYVFNTMAKNRVFPDVRSYNIMINGFCKSKMIDDALNLFEEMRRKNLVTDTVTYNGLFKSGRLKNAKEIFQDLSIKGCSPNVRTYNIMIHGLCKEGLFEEALALLSELEDNGCLPDAVTFETLIRALFEKDENDMAEKLLREMVARGLLN
nr:pentatricopeptide repeat-containing protein At1g12300, mitochondrial-like [Arachis hypogaea]